MTTMQRVLPRFGDIRWTRLLAISLLVLTVASVALNAFLWSGQRFQPPPVSFIRGQSILVVEMFMAVSYAAMGALLSARLARNPLGWLFLAIGLGTSLQMTTTLVVQQGHEAFRPLEPAALWAAWLSSTVHLPVTVTLFVLVFLLFPDGRPLSRRWGWAGWLSAIGTVLVVFAAGLEPSGLIWFPSLPNPLGAPAAAQRFLPFVAVAGLLLMVAGTLLATASMVVRYRRAGEVQQAQLRWIAAAVLLLAGGGLPFVISRYAFDTDYAAGELLLFVALSAGCFLPIAAAVAVLRHRLYDIDLIINRALVYIPLTGILGGLYAAGVALFQRVFVTVTGDRSDAAVVITTLVLAGLFTPIKNWLQAIVDHHFKPHVRPATAATSAGGGGAIAAESASHTPATLEALGERIALLEHRLNEVAAARDRSDR